MNLHEALTKSIKLEAPRRKPLTLKRVYRKSKIVLTCCGVKVFEAKYISSIEAFEKGWYGYEEIN